MLCCGGTHDQRLWLHTSAEGTSEHLREKQETSLTSGDLADADTVLRRQTTDPHPGCDASCYRLSGRRGCGVEIGVNIGSQSE